MSDWTADLLFKSEVAMLKIYMVSEKRGNYDKIDLDYRIEKENEDSVNIGKEKT